MRERKQCGFTLVELSIVLVIIALIVGGVLGGKDLIEAAALRKDISQIEQLKTAALTFKGKYNALPGDMTNPNSFFTVPYNSNEFGNGNGIVGEQVGGGAQCTGISMASNSTGSSTFGEAHESRGFFDQLARANLIPLTAFDISAANWANTKMPGIGYLSSALNPSVGIFIAASPTNHQTYIYYGAQNHAAQPYVMTSYNNFTPNQSHAIDTKIDDGMPASGKIIQWNDLCVTAAYLNNCQNTGSTPYIYRSTDAPTLCGLAIIPGF